MWHYGDYNHCDCGDDIEYEISWTKNLNMYIYVCQSFKMLSLIYKRTVFSEPVCYETESAVI